MALVLEAAILTTLLSPLLRSAYGGDDVATSQGPAWRQFNSVGLWQWFLEQNSYWMHQQGRLFPGSLLETVVVFDIFETRAAYKVVQLVAALLAWAVVVAFIGVLTRSLAHAVATGWLLLLNFQFRKFHYPLLQFSLQQPTVVMCFFGTLLLVTLATRARSRPRFVVCVVGATCLWVSGVLVYETLYPLIVLPLAIIVHSLRSRRRYVAAAALILPTVVLLGVITHLRMNAVAPTAAYQLSPSPIPFLRTFIFQTTGTLPLSYQSLAHAPGVPGLLSGWGIDGLADVALLLASLAVVALVLRGFRPVALDRFHARLLFVGGLLIFLAPSAIIALTRRWQQGEVTWGTPYVSVFLAGTGLMIAVVAAIEPLVHILSSMRSLVDRRRWSRVAGCIAACGLIAVAALVPLLMLDTNRKVVDASSALRTEREHFQDLVEAGVLDGVPDGSILITENASDWFWENGSFIQYHGGPRQLTVVRADDPVADGCGVSQQCYRLIDEAGRRPSVITIAASSA